MCGIAGVIDRSLESEKLRAQAQRLTEAVAHRGPDGHGLLVRDGVALGHRRLAIIDVAGGAQPMGNEDGQVQVSFNGEVYNFDELRRELIALGHRFVTQSDTEVIVHGYEQWGTGVVNRLRGMFAFAIADFTKQRLLLARDPFGIKPLFYGMVGSSWFFASELAAIRRVFGQDLEVSKAGVNDFLRFGYVAAPRTVFENVEELPPGHSIELALDGAIDRPTRYHAATFGPIDESPLSDEDTLAEFDRVVSDSVEAHLVSDVPFGVFLSGGIDSTLIAMHMARLLGGRVKAFTIGFDEAAYSELRYARQAADALGIELIYDVIREDAVDVLPQLIRAYGQPYADSSALPTWQLSRLAREHVPMVLSGDGGDETFAGYNRYDLLARRNRRMSLLSQVIRRQGDWPLILRLLHASPLGKSLSRPTAAATLVNYLPAGMRRSLWRPEHRESIGDPAPAFEAACSAGTPDALDDVAWYQQVDYGTYLPFDILAKVDIASMQHGLEVRTPLIDRAVFDFARRLPLRQRWRDGVGKVLPKRSLGETFGQAFVHRKKMGFSIPRDEWMKRGRPMREMLEDALASPACPLHDWFELKAIRRLMRMHDMTGKFSTAAWPLLVLAVWAGEGP
ncbi:MAG: asparagine synthase (glutamine-hydrolyzing) [Planctomycetota bacterium]